MAHMGFPKIRGSTCVGVPGLKDTGVHIGVPLM